MALGEARWAPIPPTTWPAGVDRFFAGLAALDGAIAGDGYRGSGAAIFQGPIADSLTHIGQLAMLRGTAG